MVGGGGQPGLAVGHYLRQLGLPFVILDEQDQIGDAWRKRWDSLRHHYSLSSALLGGVGRDAKHIVDHIVSTQPARMESSARARSADGGRDEAS